MRITTKGRYALRAVSQLAANYTDKPISIRELAEMENLSPEFLEQIFYKLRKAGLINSTRGPGGGFSLNRPPEEISITEIFDAVGEGMNLAPCAVNGANPCKHPGCITHSVWVKASNHLKEYFGDISIKDIVEANPVKV
jgi:Rrf2 family iron-sulfur cluster assembly transcriptional regulator